MISIAYTNCSACSQNTQSMTDGECSNLPVDDAKTQICIKNPSSNGCKQIDLCNEITAHASNKICSKLSVSSSNINTHVCIMSINYTECQIILKKKYGLPNEEELMLIKSDKLVQYFDDNSFEYQLFSYSLGAFLPLSECSFCKEEDLCINVKYVDSEEKCRRLKSISSNQNTNYQCIKNPEPNATNCIETNKCTDIKIGAKEGQCERLNAESGKVCIKDQSSDSCKETDLCQEIKNIFSPMLDICSTFKVSNSTYMKCVRDLNTRGCVETKFKCEERDSINNVSEELCNMLETNDNTEKCIKNNNNCKLIKYCNYAKGENNNECEKFPVQNQDNICLKKDEENKCVEVNKSDVTSQNKDNKDSASPKEGHSINIPFSLSFDLLCILIIVL